MKNLEKNLRDRNKKSFMKKKEMFYDKTKCKKSIKGESRKKFFKQKVDGYTFVETLSVLAISTVLAAGTTISATKAISYARKTAAKNQIEQYRAALQTYFLDCGRFPTTEQGLSALWEKPILYPIPENWDGPYLERKPSTDPWGTDFEYISAESSALPSEVSAKLPFILLSYGADRKKGGEGNDADIVSWK